MRTLQESRDINAIKVLYYPMSVSLLQLWAQFGIWTLCITKIMERIYGLLSYIACENIKAKVPTRFTNLHELDIAHYLFFFSIRVFHTSHLDVVYRWTKLTFPCIIIRTVSRLTGTLSLRTIFFSLAMSRWKHKLKMEERWGSSLSRQSDLCGN